MRVLITGASGFLGKAVVRAAVRAGHEVVALVRPTAAIPSDWPDGVRVIRGDLRQVRDWAKQIKDVDAVAHLAAATSGDFVAQFSGTVLATENLLAHLSLQSLRRFVHVSTFSVYDYGAVGLRGVLDERSPIEPHPEKRDAYTITKLLQERMVREACRSAGTPFVVIRPGAIFGSGKDWGFGRVLKVGGFDLIFSPGARFPLTFVDNCADAIVRALDADVASGAVFNIVDDNLPTFGRYHRLGRRLHADGAGPAIYIPWAGVRLAGAAVALINRLGFGGRAKLPEFLDLYRQRVRWQPMSFSNDAAKRALRWKPAISLEEALATSVGKQPGSIAAEPAKANGTGISKVCE